MLSMAVSECSSSLQCGGSSMSSSRGSSGKAVEPIDGCGSGGDTACGRVGPMPTDRPLPVTVVEVEGGDTREAAVEEERDGDNDGAAVGDDEELALCGEERSAASVDCGHDCMNGCGGESAVSG